VSQRGVHIWRLQQCKRHVLGLCPQDARRAPHYMVRVDRQLLPERFEAFRRCEQRERLLRASAWAVLLGVADRHMEQHGAPFSLNEISGRTMISGCLPFRSSNIDPFGRLSKGGPAASAQRYAYSQPKVHHSTQESGTAYWQHAAVWWARRSWSATPV